LFTPDDATINKLITKPFDMYVMWNYIKDMLKCEMDISWDNV